MSKITEELNAEYVNSILQYGTGIKEMIGKLEAKGEELAEKIKGLDELEGEVDIAGDMRVLKKCPMVPVLEDIKRKNAELIGQEVLPEFYPEVVEKYIEEHPLEGSILHPLCIMHQHVRKAFGSKHGYEIQQVACRSGSTGKVVFSENGLKEAGITKDEAQNLIKDKACLYICLIASEGA